MIMIITDVVFWALPCSIASLSTVTHFTDKKTEAQGLAMLEPRFKPQQMMQN